MMISKLRTFALAATAVCSALAIATPAEAGFGIRWGAVEVNSDRECMSLLQSGATALGYRNLQIRPREVNGGTGALQQDGTSQVWVNTTCLREDSGKSFAVIIAAGLAQDAAVMEAARDALVSYVDQHRSR